MNLMDAIDEIGIFETNLNIYKYLNNKELLYNISKYIPISSFQSGYNVKDVIVEIINLHKRNIMLLSNEISILDGLLEYKEFFDNIIVVLSKNLNNIQIKNIINNSPDKSCIEYISELEFPSLIKPKNSAIISFGYKKGNKCLLTKNNYRMLMIYNNFLGEKVFISCSKEKVDIRPMGWVLINGENHFTKLF